MRTEADSDRRSPGRPRSTRADEAIVDAVLAMLEEGTPLEAISVEAVASRAGVGKATIYRRWPCKDALVVDAVSTLKPPLPDIAGVSLRDDLVALLQAAGCVRKESPDRVLPCLIPQVVKRDDYYDLLQRIVEPRREAIRDVLRRGIRSGELRDDLDIEAVVAALGSAMVMQRTLRWNPALSPDRLPERLVDLVLDGARARPASARAGGDRCPGGGA